MDRWSAPTSQTVSGVTALTPVLELASGGMGAVELAVRRDGDFERLYAVKRPKASLMADPEFRRMFFDEARIAGLLRHTNVVSVLDVGEDARGPFLVMDYVDGLSISALLRSAAAGASALPTQLCLRVVVDAARGLHAAHELTDHKGRALQIVHRDVSPQNILVAFDGVSRVTDFGIAKALDKKSQTSTGMLKGKIGYMAPERLRFERGDPRSDVFSLGIVLYELLSGERLYGDRDIAAAARRINLEPPPDVATVRTEPHPLLVELVFDMLAKEVDDRPASMESVIGVLDELIALHAAAEGPFDVGAFVRERFADARETRRAAIAAALDRLREDAKTPTRPVAWRWALAAVLAASAATGAFLVDELVLQPDHVAGTNATKQVSAEVRGAPERAPTVEPVSDDGASPVDPGPDPPAVAGDQAAPSPDPDRRQRRRTRRSPARVVADEGSAERAGKMFMVVGWTP